MAEPVTTMPSPSLPDASVSPAIDDPTTLSAPEVTAMPETEFGTAAVPPALVPTRLPAIVLPFEPAPVIRTPYAELPDSTFIRDETLVRPTRLFDEERICTPSPPFVSAAVPAAFVPM